VTPCKLVPRTRKNGNADRILVRKQERKRQLGRIKRRWEYIIRIDVRDII
jgi:hypothetical protein